MITQKEIGENIKKTLKKNKKTITWLAREVRWTDMTVRRWIWGDKNMPAVALFDVANALGVSADELLGLAPANEERRKYLLIKKIVEEEE